MSSIARDCLASELTGSDIGRVVTFDGPKDSRIKDELVGIVAIGERDEILLLTRSSAPYDIMSFPDQYFRNGWKVGWGAMVEVRGFAKTNESANKSEGKS